MGSRHVKNLGLKLERVCERSAPPVYGLSLGSVLPALLGVAGITIG